MGTTTRGLIFGHEIKLGTNRVTVRVLLRREGEESPCNASGYGTDGDSGLDGLLLDGWISDYTGKMTGFTAFYSGLYSVDLRRARAMAKTLERVEKQRAKDSADEAGDVFVSFAKALGCTWVATADGQYSMYADTAWRYSTIAQGRNDLRWMIANLEKEAEPTATARREREVERARAREAVA